MSTEAQGDATLTAATTSSASRASISAADSTIAGDMEVSEMIKRFLEIALEKQTFGRAEEMLASSGFLHLQLIWGGDIMGPFDGAIPTGSDGVYWLSCRDVATWKHLTLAASNNAAETFLTVESGEAWAVVWRFLSKQNKAEFVLNGRTLQCHVHKSAKKTIEMSFYDRSKGGWEGVADAYQASFADPGRSEIQEAASTLDTIPKQNMKRPPLYAPTLEELPVITQPSETDLQMTTVSGAIPDCDRTDMTLLGEKDSAIGRGDPVAVLDLMLWTFEKVKMRDRKFKKMLKTGNLSCKYYVARRRDVREPIFLVGNGIRHTGKISLTSAQQIVRVTDVTDWRILPNDTAALPWLRLWLESKAHGVVRTQAGVSLFCSCQMVDDGIRAKKGTSQGPDKGKRRFEELDMLHERGRKEAGYLEWAGAIWVVAFDMVSD